MKKATGEACPMPRWRHGWLTAIKRAAKMMSRLLPEAQVRMPVKRLPGGHRKEPSHEREHVQKVVSLDGRPDFLRPT